MPRLHLRHQRAGDVLHRERAALLGHHRVEEDLEEEIAQLVAQRRIVALTDRVVDFVRLLDQIRAERAVRLHPVPFAACPQIPHQGQRVVHRPLHRFSVRRWLLRMCE